MQMHGGPLLRGIDYTMPMASAQVKSAMLLAGLYGRGAHARHRAGADARSHRAHARAPSASQVQREGATRQPRGRADAAAAPHVEVPADFSSAAFFLVAGCLAARDGLLLRNVGVNPTRTGLLQMLQLMGARDRVQPHARRRRRVGEPIADIEVHASALRGIEVPEALVPLAIDEFPVFFIAAACATGETRGARRAGAARQGKRSAGGHGRGPEEPGRRAYAAAGWHADPRRPGLQRRHGRQSRRSPHRHGLCDRQPEGPRADPDPGCGQCRDVFPGFRRAGARVLASASSAL